MKTSILPVLIFLATGILTAAAAEVARMKQESSANLDAEQAKILNELRVRIAELGPESDRVSVNINGLNAIVLAVVPQPTANPLDISKEVTAVLPMALVGRGFT